MKTLRRRIGALQSYLRQREDWLGFEGVSDPRGARGKRWPLRGLLVMGLLRAMAYNLLAIARAVHLRTKPLPGWAQLRDWMRDALLWPELGELPPEPDPAPD